MTEKKIASYQIKEIIDVHKIFQIFRSHPPGGWWFRGQSDISWDLLPKAGRQNYLLDKDRDLGRFNDWKQQAISYNKEIPDNNWECLALAQHYGLATRLLDWTYNPLVALYFAVNENYESDGAVYCYEPDLFIKIKNQDFIAANGVWGLIARNIATRLLNQKAVFTAHSPSNQEIEVKDHWALKELYNLVKIIIPKSMKLEILNHLNDYGINNVTLFPDLDGLSEHINWVTVNMVNFKEGNTPY